MIETNEFHGNKTTNTMNEQIRNISPEDRRKLTQAFQEQSAKTQAEQMGTNQNNLHQRVVDGKYQWVQQAKTLQEDERKKRILATSRPARALRDGENSLVSLIQKSLDKFYDLAEQFKQSKNIQQMDYIDCMNTAKKIFERTETYANQLSEVENKIELSKAQNPVFQEAEKLLLLMSQLKKQHNNKKLNQLQKQNAPLLISYQNQRKSLTPLIENARQLRTDLQREYWRIMQSNWNLYKSVFVKNLNACQDKIESIPNGEVKTSNQQEIKEVKMQFDSLTDREDTLRLSLPTTIGASGDNTLSWDEIIPDMSSILVEMEFMNTVLPPILQNLNEEALNKNTQPTNRMAFKNKKDG